MTYIWFDERNVFFLLCQSVTVIAIKNATIQLLKKFQETDELEMLCSGVGERVKRGWKGTGWSEQGAGRWACALEWVRGRLLWLAAQRREFESGDGERGSCTPFAYSVLSAVLCHLILKNALIGMFCRSPHGPCGGFRSGPTASARRQNVVQ